VSEPRYTANYFLAGDDWDAFDCPEFIAFATQYAKDHNWPQIPCPPIVICQSLLRFFSNVTPAVNLAKPDADSNVDARILLEPVLGLDPSSLLDVASHLVDNLCDQGLRFIETFLAFSTTVDKDIPTITSLISMLEVTPFCPPATSNSDGLRRAINNLWTEARHSPPLSKICSLIYVRQRPVWKNRRKRRKRLTPSSTSS
jgi:hypothetical protein